jgi:NAD(P)H dehydrogenase (quinone)
MFVVTSAAGFSGRNVCTALLRRGHVVRAFVKNETQAETLRVLGAQQTVVGDIASAADARRALDGVRAVYLICPRFHEDEPGIVRTWIAEAERMRTPRFVYQGVAHPYIQAMPHHWDKLQGQLMLEQSTLPYAVIQPTNYMRNVTWAWNWLLTEGRYTLPYSATTLLTWVDADDVAEAAAMVLTEPGHEGGAYELCGTPDGLSRAHICQLLSTCLGRPIEAATATWETWRQLPRYRGWSEGQMARLKAMFDYYDRHGLRAGNPRVLSMLLGRPATTYAQYLQRLMRLPENQRQAVL